MIQCLMHVPPSFQFVTFVFKRKHISLLYMMVCQSFFRPVLDSTKFSSFIRLGGIRASPPTNGLLLSVLLLPWDETACGIGCKCLDMGGEGSWCGKVTSIEDLRWGGSRVFELLGTVMVLWKSLGFWLFGIVCDLKGRSGALVVFESPSPRETLLSASCPKTCNKEMCCNKLISWQCQKSKHSNPVDHTFRCIIWKFSVARQCSTGQFFFTIAWEIAFPVHLQCECLWLNDCYWKLLKKLKLGLKGFIGKLLKQVKINSWHLLKQENENGKQLKTDRCVEKAE